jgi:two-component system, chemotaxis family, chemotaxis protein CheY
MRTVLVVEDSRLMQAFYRSTLAALSDYEVRFARNGLEAFDDLVRSGDPDIILLDINMPVMDGLEFLRRYGDAGSETPATVVIVSTEGDADDIQRGLAAGAAAYLTKPIDAEQIRTVVQRIAAERGHC